MFFMYNYFLQMIIMRYNFFRIPMQIFPTHFLNYKQCFYLKNIDYTVVAKI